jgi:hypothetical protein
MGHLCCHRACVHVWSLAYVGITAARSSLRIMFTSADCAGCMVVEGEGQQQHDRTAAAWGTNDCSASITCLSP